MNKLEQYWSFAAVCVVSAVLLLRMVVRERITLQGSMGLLGFLGVGAAAALVPGLTHHLTHLLGFTLQSNLIFAGCIVALAALHVSTLVSVSRLELRSIALAQELAILQERMDRLSKAGVADLDRPPG